jgi:hypothetical protein
MTLRRVALCILVLLAVSPPARAEILSCKLGAYVSDLKDLDPAAKTFGARLWFWTLCPENDQEPLQQQLSFSNSDQVEKGSFSQKLSAGQQWGLIRAEGKFRHPWDSRDFPFERQTLEVIVTAGDDFDHFRFLPDSENSSYNPDIQIPGWRITALRLVSGEHQYTTTFGDPTLANGQGSKYSRVRLQIDIERSDRTLFFKTTGALYAAFLFALFSFLMPNGDTSAMEVRMGMLGASLFAAILNMQMVEGSLRNEGLTLVDKLHLLTLAYILLGVTVTIISWRRLARGSDSARVMKMNKSTFVWGTAVYVIATASLLTLALWFRP